MRTPDTVLGLQAYHRGLVEVPHRALRGVVTPAPQAGIDDALRPSDPREHLDRSNPMRDQVVPDVGDDNGDEPQPDDRLFGGGPPAGLAS